ncbi:MAG: ABC transporter ATP-binding protein [Proteobacteria bacterium]|nr:ABC transporter ATP-binding protein [Pseudomonadota bacterium]
MAHIPSALKSATTHPLVVSGITKSFGDHKVLNSVSLQVPKGHIYGLIGLNGVGKTTLIKIILSLLSPDAGQASLFDQDVSKIETRKSIAYLPEKFIPSVYLRGLEFLSLTLSYYGKKLNVEEARILAEDLDLDVAALSLPMTKYSKGMTQKLGLIATLLTEAPLLILDEPMSGLDPKARIKLKDALVRYVKKGNTIFFTSHVLSDIDEICKEIAVIHNGNIVFTGTPAGFKKTQREANLERAFLKVVSGETPKKTGATKKAKKAPKKRSAKRKR